MKKLIVLFIGVFFIQFSFGQSVDIYGVILNPTSKQKSSISRAKRDIGRADKLVSAAQKAYQKYSKLFNSKRKRKRRRAEKKTVSAKRNLMTAGTFYDKGYKALYDLYTDYLKGVSFSFPEDQQKAANLMSEAENFFKTGESILQKNRGFTDKELKKKVQFKKLQGSIYKGRDNEKQAIEKLAQAIQLYNMQGEKLKAQQQKEDNLWQQALQANTISAYQNYINAYPDGRYVSLAQQKIAEIEQQIKEAEQNKESDIIYRVQILADVRPWTDNEIKAKYGISDHIYESFYNGWYKYSVGEFHKYEDAKQKRDQIRKKVKGAFVIAFTKDGQYIDNILEAINLEQSSQK